MKTFLEYIENINEALKIELNLEDKSKEKEAKKIIQDYDFYTGAIDDLKQMKSAEANNKYILSLLSKIGVTSFTVKDFKGVGSNTKKDLVIKTK